MKDQIKPKAWIVPVWTKRLGGGQPALTMYIAGFSEPNDAVEAVKRHIRALEGDDVQEPAPVSDATAQALGVSPSSVRML